jgi:GntR family transcriptional repressor for pyruvate dehydrogenase complex
MSARTPYQQAAIHLTFKSVGPTLKTLTARTKETLKLRVEGGSLAPGEKLPTLNELATELGVSRTVVREAVAALRSDGLLEARHGVGVFVRGPQNAATEPEAEPLLAPLAKLETSFMDLLELRMAFEVHAAGLAATRRSWAQEASIWEALKQFEGSLEDDSALDQLDFTFHRCIAEATNNGAFIEFFSVMSLKIMPQPAFSREMYPALLTREYIQHTVVEHRAICEAISAGDAELARDAMRNHLTRSHRRYRGLTDQPL